MTHPPLLVLQDALDHRLIGPDRIAVDEHLAACDACRRQVHALRWTTVRLAGVGAGVAMPAALGDEIARMLASAARRADGATAAPVRSPPRLARRGWRRWAGWLRSSRP